VLVNFRLKIGFFSYFDRVMIDKFIRTALLTLLIMIYTVFRPEVQGYQQQERLTEPLDPPFLAEGAAWADSLMQKMNLEERIAQMIMVYGYSNMGPEHEKAVLRQVKRQKVGGILFFQGEPREQARLTNLFQEAADIPLLVAIDGENGLGMRLENTIAYPATMILGGISDNHLIYRLGAEMGKQFRRLGVHMNLAPVADINNNPANPVIGSRSYGEDRYNVTSKVVAMMEGMQDQRVLVAAKHFPGHGDTDSDSHRTLPLIPHERDRLDSLELYPFRQAIGRGLTGIMVAHLQVPALDARKMRPTTLSRPAIGGLLKEEMGLYREAREAYAKEIALLKDFIPARFNLGRLLLKQGDRRGYVGHMEEIVKINPRSAKGHLFLARGLLYESQDYDQILGLVNKGLEYAQESELKALGYFLMADVYNRKKEPTRVREALKKANYYKEKSKQEK